MEYHSKWSNRRSASGTIKPFVFLIVEVGALAIACWFVSLFNILMLTILVLLVAIFFFIISSLPRYRKVITRQKYYKDEETK